MSKSIPTPKIRKTQNGGGNLESRVTVLERLFAATLPFLATKADIAEAKAGMFKTALGIVSINTAMLAIAVTVILRAVS